MKKMLKIKRFTLIEMLVVLSIIGIMLSISLPAFSRLMAGQGVSGGARELGGMLSMTRAYAIGNNCYAAVIIPGGTGSTAFSGSSSTKLNFCAYRPCVVTPKYSGGVIQPNQWNFASWVDETKWSVLPSGVVVTNTSDGIDNVVTNGDTITVSGETSTSKNFFKDLLDETVSDITFNAVVFRPSGIPSTSSSAAGIYYVRAGTPNGTSVIETDPNHKNNYKLTINQYTGRLKYEQGQ